MFKKLRQWITGPVPQKEAINAKPEEQALASPAPATIPSSQIASSSQPTIPSSKVASSSQPTIPSSKVASSSQPTIPSSKVASSSQPTIPSSKVASSSQPTIPSGNVASSAAATIPSGKLATADQAQDYLQKVQGKIGHLAEEFAAGVINQAQFQELFDHYRREQQTVRRLIEIAPYSDAWKEATTEGKSVIIRAEHMAKVLGYAIYENNSGMPLNTIGQFEVDPELVVPMLSSYRAATKEIFGAGMRSSQIEGGRWLCFVPGEFCTLMALFSTGPAARQLESLEELHRLFERANRNLLSAAIIDPDHLVFPHAYYLGRVE